MVKSYYFIGDSTIRSIEDAINFMRIHSEEHGCLVSTMFNGVTLYSDVDDVDSAYLKIEGKTKSELQESSIKKLFKQDNIGDSTKTTKIKTGAIGVPDLQNGTIHGPFTTSNTAYQLTKPEPSHSDQISFLDSKIDLTQRNINNLNKEKDQYEKQIETLIKELELLQASRKSIVDAYRNV